MLKYRFQNKTIFILSLVVFIGILFSISTTSLAQTVFNRLNYTGRIVDTNGAPKTGPVNLSVTFYETETGTNQKGDVIDIDNVTLVEGAFSLKLKFQTVKSIKFSPPLPR